MKTRIRKADRDDVRVILDLIRALAEFEKLSHEVVATEAMLEETLFGEKPSAEVLIMEHELEHENEARWANSGFALYFTTYSTFLAKPGIYLEDLFIRPELRSHGFGRKMLQRLAQIAVERGCGRLEWSVLDWNVRAREFYENLGARPMGDWTVHRLTGTALGALADEGL
ncbi:MAG: GNAT family N-acetyltransferase [Bdellovibrionota bacterium]